MTESEKLKKTILLIMRLLVIVAAALLVATISFDSLRNMSFVADPFYEKLQIWVCYFFLFDIVVEFALSGHRLHYLWSNLLFIIVSIPYMQIIHYFGWNLPESVVYAIRFMPLIRAAYVIGILFGAITRNRMTTLFVSYMTILVVSLYFGSLMFFIAEQPVNPDVKTWWDAFWWAIMDMNTCGSSISEMTATGQVLAVVLAAEGLILFPVFTVYITAALTKDAPAADDAAVAKS